MSPKMNFRKPVMLAKVDGFFLYMAIIARLTLSHHLVMHQFSQSFPLALGTIGAPESHALL